MYLFSFWLFSLIFAFVSIFFFHLIDHSDRTLHYEITPVPATLESLRNLPVSLDKSHTMTAEAVLMPRRTLPRRLRPNRLRSRRGPVRKTD